jgi:hypothetical protein
MIYIRILEENILDTFILKKKHDDFTFICAIGDGGGGVIEEFCGKFFYDNKLEDIRGFCASVHDPDEWEKEVFDQDIVNESTITVQDADKAIIDQMVREIWKEYLQYDDATETRLIRKKYLSKMKKMVYMSKDWDPDIVDLISNYHWRLTERIDY